ncbi:hypothetical protein GH714_003717 [Hevea brasiliensis]|uniref:Uncharacterized protein n=1 Tax=Hevea brasiliensis TaxID=3981 RepID=A0A6A6LB21_HEVBR|nr:hypothetical protein GH714_003717 [Hevea brasiliensis]
MTIIVRWHYGGAFVNNPYPSYLGGIEESLIQHPRVVEEIGKDGTLELYVGHIVDESNVSSSEDDSYITSSDKEDSTYENLDDNSDEEDFLSTLEGSDVDEELRNDRETVRELKKNKSGKQQAKSADEGINLREADVDVGFENVEGNNQRYDGKITEDEDY